MQKSVSSSSIQVLFGSFSGKLINLITLFIVTPFLGPEGFGQLLVVGIIAGIFNTVIDIGFENYYIIKVRLTGPDKMEQDEIDTVENIIFKLRLYSNLFLFLLQIAISYLAVDIWFKAPVDLYLRILAFNYIANIFGKINETRLKKRMNFGPITSAKIRSDIVGAITKIVLVVLGYGIIGFAIGLVAGNAVNNVLLSIAGNFKPSIRPIPPQWRKEIIWFSKHSWLTGLGIYLNGQSSNIILKSFFPLDQTGFIQFGNSYTIEIQSGLLASQMYVLFPYYANYKDDPDRITRSIHQFVEASYFIFAFPAVLGIVYSRELVSFLFGAKWMPAAPVLSIYCVYLLIRLLFSPCLSILTSLGKMKEVTKLSYFTFSILLVALLVTGYFTRNIYWYAGVFVLVSLLSEFLKAIWGLHFLHISMVTLFLRSLSTFLCIAAVLLAAIGLKMIFPNPSTFHFMGIISGLAICFLTLQFLFNRKIYFLFYDKAMAFIKR